MFANSKEQDFFLSHINSNNKVLEYGSGESTLEIAEIAKSIVSVEHQPLWYNKLINLIPNNCKLLLQTPNKPYTEGISCGTYEEFKSYINAPIQYRPFDIILIDGRARVECAKICHLMSHKETIIFIHDFDRKEYHVVNGILKLVSQAHTMAKFKIK
jgi:hypothetical protein